MAKRIESRNHAIALAKQYEGFDKAERIAVCENGNVRFNPSDEMIESLKGTKEKPVVVYMVKGEEKLMLKAAKTEEIK